jgi:hypothetical protein
VLPQAHHLSISIIRPHRGLNLLNLVYPRL